MDWREILTELERTLSQYSETLELLRSIDAELAKNAFDLDNVLGLIAGGAQRLTAADFCDILVRDSLNTLRVEWSTKRDIIGEEVPVEGSLTGMVFREGRSVREGNVASDISPYFPLVPGTTSELAVPMTDEHGDIVAVINLESEKRDYFSEEHQRVVTLLAGQGAIAIRNAAIHKQFMAILELAVDLDPSSPTLRPVLSMIGERAKELTLAEHCQVLQPFNGELIIEFTTGPEEPGATRVRVDSSVSGLAYERKASVLIEDIATDLRAKVYKGFVGAEMKSELVIPIAWKGEVLALINLESPRPAAFRAHHERIVSLLANQAAVAIANVKRFQSTLWTSQAQGDLWALAQIGDVYGPLIHRLNSDAGAITAILSEVRATFPELDPSLQALLSDIQKKAHQILEVPVKLRRSMDRLHSHEDMNLNTIIEGFLLPLEQLDALSVRKRLSQALRTVNASPQLEEMVEVFIRNAVEAISERGVLEVEARAWTSVAQDGTRIENGVEMVVADSCGGIPADVEEHLWEIDFTTKQASKKRGSGFGFGLWWARSFVQRMGGEVVLKSVVDLEGGEKGCRFIVRLPFEARRVPVTMGNQEE